MKPEDEITPSTPDFDESEGEETPIELDETAKEIYNEENHEFVAEVQNLPSFIVDMFGRQKVDHEFHTALEKYTILAARCGLGTFEGGTRKPETSEGSFTAYLTVSIPKSVMDDRGVAWEDLAEQFDAALKPLADYVDKAFEPAESDEEEDED